MTAQPVRAIEDLSEAEIRQSLLRARDIALNNVADMPLSVTRDLNQSLATIANEFRRGPFPRVMLNDALKLCRYLMVAQNLAGQLDGQYPTDRYSA